MKSGAVGSEYLGGIELELTSSPVLSIPSVVVSGTAGLEYVSISIPCECIPGTTGFGYDGRERVLSLESGAAESGQGVHLVACAHGTG